MNRLAFETSPKQLFVYKRVTARCTTSLFPRWSYECLL